MYGSNAPQTESSTMLTLLGEAGDRAECWRHAEQCLGIVYTTAQREILGGTVAPCTILAMTAGAGKTSMLLALLG